MGVISFFPALYSSKMQKKSFNLTIPLTKIKELENPVLISV